MASNAIRPSPKQERFLESLADICIYGGGAGSGKSWALLLEPLYHVKNPGFHAVIFRRTYPQITQPGGLWDQSCKVYPQMGATPNQTDMRWKFPSGATVRFAHLQHDKNVFDWQGSEIPLIEFDELTHYTEQQFWYLLSRNRSLSGVKPYVRASCNPDVDSWVAQLLAWWINQETGLPIPDRAGQLRWFARVNDQLVWGDSKAELQARHPDIPPKSLSFIPATLSDNPELTRSNPDYKSTLLALPLVERERLLGGNWKIAPAAGLIFNRAWFRIVEAAPAETVWVRYWDKASTPGSGDFTAGVKVGRAGSLYFVGDSIRGQWSSADRNRVILQTAKLDGQDCEVWVEQEGGSGGKESAEISIRELAGYIIRAERVTGDKVTRARQFSAQAEAGNVLLLRGDWNKAFLDEYHSFPQSAHDDAVDAGSGAFNKLANAFREAWDATPPPGSKSVWSQLPKGFWGDTNKDDDRDEDDIPSPSDVYGDSERDRFSEW